MALKTKEQRMGTKLDAKQKLELEVAKVFARVLDKYDAASVNEYLATFARYGDVMNQRGDGENKRFSGAATHAWADNETAFIRRVTAGNIPSIG